MRFNSHYAVFLVLMCSAAAHGQVNAVDANSAAAAQRIQDFRNQGLEAAAMLRAAGDNGRLLFGVDDARSGDTYAGTLASKSPDEFRIGDWGLSHRMFAVRSIVSPTEILVDPKYPGADVMLLRGVDTSKVIDGAEFIFPRPVVIAETYAYTAISGAQKTVLVLDARPQKIDAIIAAQKAEAEARRAKLTADFVAAEPSRYRTLKKPVPDVECPVRVLQFKLEKGKTTAMLELQDGGKQIVVPFYNLHRDDQKWVREEYERLKQQFFGDWQILAENGNLASVFTLRQDFTASRLHNPSVKGEWEIVGNEVRIVWPDGPRHTMRFNGGSAETLAFPKGADPAAPPNRIFTAIKK